MLLNLPNLYLNIEILVKNRSYIAGKIDISLKKKNTNNVLLAQEEASVERHIYS